MYILTQIMRLIVNVAEPHHFDARPGSGKEKLCGSGLDYTILWHVVKKLKVDTFRYGTGSCCDHYAAPSGSATLFK
jgi:hypothetical protein